MAEEMINTENGAVSRGAASSSTSLVPQSPLLNAAILNGTYPPGTGNGQREGLSQLREWRLMLLRHKLLILALVLLIVPFAAIQAYRPKPIYEAFSTIEVRRESSEVLKGSEPIFLDPFNNTKAEAYILKSRPVLQQAALELQLDKQPMFLEVGTRRSVIEALRALSGKDIETEKKKKAAAAARITTDANAPVEFKNETDTENNAAIRERMAPYVGMLAEGLKVEPIRDTRLLKISYQHSDPEMAAAAVNGITNSFIKYNFETKSDRFTHASTWLDEMTREMKAKVERAQKALVDYQGSNNIYTTSAKEDLTGNKLAELSNKAMEADVQKMLKESLYQQVQQGSINQVPEAFADPKTAELRKQLNDLTVAAAQLKVRFGAKHPKLLEVREQMAVIMEQINTNQELLADKLKADYERAVRDDESMRAALDKAKSEAVKQNQANIQFGILQQDLNTAKTLYEDFLNKSNQAKIQRSEAYNNVRLVEAAEVPTDPIGPRRFTTIALGLLLSLSLGVGLAWLLENMNTSVRNIEDVSRLTALPTLALIPTLEQSAISIGRKREAGLLEGVAVEDSAIAPAGGLMHTFMNDEFSTSAEAYRMLRTSVMLSTAGHPPKTILITSGQPGDGKTTTVFNTAIAFTQLDAQVLIVDCDMRKPRMHKVVQVERGKGLSNFLSGSTELDELIRPTAIKNLSFMSCGPVPPNPSELISSGKMRELLALMGERFDYVLIDSPPVVSVTDPMILSTMVDGVILVAKSGKTRNEVLRRAHQDMSSVGAKMLGVVLNDFNVRRENYDYYYYYRYSYDYRESRHENDTYS